jgi:signal transduction histidine kinase
VRRRDQLYPWLQRHPIVPDAVLAAFVLLFTGFPANIDPEIAAIGVALAVVMCVALAFRRVLPTASFAVIAAGAAAQWALGIELSPFDLVLLLSLYAVAGYGPRWASRAGLGVGLLGVVLAIQRYFRSDPAVMVAVGTGLTVVVVAAWALGDARRLRRIYVADLVDRAERAERERDQRARLAVVEERARIAREMHDVVAHNLSVMVVQADGGRYAAAGNPDTAIAVLGTIADTGRAALAEMRRLLGVLRSEDDDQDFGPQPGLARIPELVTSVRDAGLPVTLDVAGQPRRLRPGPSLAAYRVVQEALTNTLKHAGPQAQATVRLRYGSSTLSVGVDDDGRGASALADGAGHGLVGMRERVGAYDGRVSAGAAPGGGWRVEVELPYGDDQE